MRLVIEVDTEGESWMIDGENGSGLSEVGHIELVAWLAEHGLRYIQSYEQET